MSPSGRPCPATTDLPPSSIIAPPAFFHRDVGVVPDRNPSGRGLVPEFWKSLMEHPLAFEKRIQGGAPFLVFSLFILAHPLAFLGLIRFCFGDIWRQE